jgi:hypothetical protein
MGRSALRLEKGNTPSSPAAGADLAKAVCGSLPEDSRATQLGFLAPASLPWLLGSCPARQLADSRPLIVGWARMPSFLLGCAVETSAISATGSVSVNKAVDVSDAARPLVGRARAIAARKQTRFERCLKMHETPSVLRRIWRPTGCDSDCNCLWSATQLPHRRRMWHASVRNCALSFRVSGSGRDARTQKHRV